MKKKYYLKKCPKCGSYNIKVVTEITPSWICKCNWEGKRPLVEEVSEEEYLKYAEDLK